MHSRIAVVNCKLYTKSNCVAYLGSLIRRVSELMIDDLYTSITRIEIFRFS